MVVFVLFFCPQGKLLAVMCCYIVLIAKATLQTKMFITGINNNFRTFLILFNINFLLCKQPFLVQVLYRHTQELVKKFYANM